MSSDSSSSSSVSSRAPSPDIASPKDQKRKRKQRTEDAPIESDSSDSDSSEDETEEPSVESEEPVLSHKEKRKRKKEEKLAAKLAEEGKAVKKRKLQNGTAKEVTNTARKNSVWVGNMSFKTEQDDLRRFFKDVGEITRINLPTKAPTGPGVKPQNRGFAYVDFATPESKAAAIALSEQPLLGRKLLIKDGDDFSGRPAAINFGESTFSDPALAHKTHSKTAQKILRAQKQPPAPTLFFGNLGFDTTDESLRELLDAHRPPQPKQKDAQKANDEEEGTEPKKKQENWIRKIRLGTFEDSGVCKGFGFVDFTSIEHATAALINPRNHQLNGRKLVVEYAGADAVRRGAPKGPKTDRPRGDKFKSSDDSPKKFRPQKFQHDREEPAELDEAAPLVAEQKETSKRPQKERHSHSESQDGVRHKGPKNRPKPGAALALAKRESAAIMPSQGKKIVF
ncbi:hypothetical protein CVT24_011857 [Panaeolus cyanescens]|uniref:RRM domain-containing protein n=1 Tax=Panaeolus cyanescens TaxID=181874 RepID=A0A409YNJ2_9AGAR|nr:hypothetical protein CVT24_011857 [Panaeolus cyanescens]